VARGRPRVARGRPRVAKGGRRGLAKGCQGMAMTLAVLRGGHRQNAEACVLRNVLTGCVAYRRQCLPNSGRVATKLAGVARSRLELASLREGSKLVSALREANMQAVYARVVLTGARQAIRSRVKFKEESRERQDYCRRGIVPAVPRRFVLRACHTKRGLSVLRVA